MSVPNSESVCLFINVCVVDAVGQRSSNHLQHTLNEFPLEGKLLGVSGTAPQGCVPD